MHTINLIHSFIDVLLPTEWIERINERYSSMNTCMPYQKARFWCETNFGKRWLKLFRFDSYNLVHFVFIIRVYFNATWKFRMFRKWMEFLFCSIICITLEIHTFCNISSWNAHTYNIHVFAAIERGNVLESFPFQAIQKFSNDFSFCI